MAKVDSSLGIRLPIELGAQLLKSSISLIIQELQGFPKPRQLNGHNGHSSSNGHALEVYEPIECEEIEERTAWDPSSPLDVSRCKALLLEILRRAAHDWVLYRSHRKLMNREIAQDAYAWLFEEDEEHPSWKERASESYLFGKEPITGVKCITSFLAICDILELDPEVVRTRVKEMTIQTIISAGRPAETRKVKANETLELAEHGVLVAVDINAMPDDTNYESQYESYGSVATPDMLNTNDISGIY